MSRFTKKFFYDKKDEGEFANKERLAFVTLIKWCFYSIILGVVLGFLGTFATHAYNFVTNLRLENPWLVYFLPLAGVFIVFLYQIFRQAGNTGSNLIIQSVQSGEKISFRVIPLIFSGMLLTHLCGGSCGRGSANFQMGGSFGNTLGRIFRLDENDKHVLIMAGMGACYAVVFGAPAASSIFAMEVVSVGVMHYAAIVPCFLSAIIARGISKYMGIATTTFSIGDVPSINFASGSKLVLLGIIFAAVSMLYIVAFETFSKFFKAVLKNQYLIMAVGGGIVALLTLVLQSNEYLGTGISQIPDLLFVSAPWYVFLLKILFTAVSLGAGFKGGEIAPAMFVGASLGSFLAPMFGLPIPLVVACGMAAVFCGVTNSPITAIVFSVELFGASQIYYTMICVAVSYLISEYFSIYKTQKIMYSKYSTTFINRKSHHIDT